MSLVEALTWCEGKPATRRASGSHAFFLSPETFQNPTTDELGACEMDVSVICKSPYDDDDDDNCALKMDGFTSL